MTQNKTKIGVVADSSAGLTNEDFKNMKDLGFCPLIILFNENEEIVDDPKELNEEDFIDRITRKKQIAKTSQTPLGKMEKIWDEMLKKKDKIIFIPLSKGLSGQYNTASMLAKEPKFKNKVYVFDSNGVSVINAILVKKAYKMIENGENDINKILEALKKISDNFYGFILPNDINYLARGGRISKTAMAIAKSLKLKPILSYDGTIDKYDTTRTWSRAVNKTLNEIEKYQKKHNNTIKLYIIHGSAKEEEIAEVIKYAKDHGFENPEIAKLPNVITAHTGIGAFSLLAFNLSPEDF